MKPETTRHEDQITSSYLYMAIELSQKEWKLGFTIGFGQKPRLRTLAARDLVTFAEEIHLAKVRFGLAEEAGVRSCYEAGREGFWLHRYLLKEGIPNRVVDSASLEVNRRKRRAKTDRMEVGKLRTMLTPALHRTQCGASVRYQQGEKKVGSIVHVPSPEEEDQRQLHRELLAVKAERTRHSNRLKGLLSSQGVGLKVKADFLTQLEAVRLWEGSQLPQDLHARVLREYERLQWCTQHLRLLERRREEALQTASTPALAQVRQLHQLKGIGLNSSWLYVREFFSWRGFHDRREVGSLAGLTPTPYQSGESAQEQGIRKAGNRSIRAMAIELAWDWLRFQPDSQLSRGYQERFASGNSRMRRSGTLAPHCVWCSAGVVALARRLLIALWQYLETGVAPAAARLKTG